MDGTRACVARSRAANAGRGLLLCGGATEMVAHVAYEVGSDAPLHEAPLSVAPLEAVVVPTADDRLQNQAG